MNADPATNAAPGPTPTRRLNVADDGLPAPGAKVLVAMSGGVDSSVAAALLARRGCRVVGVFMRLGAEHETRPVDLFNADAADAAGLNDDCPINARGPAPVDASPAPDAKPGHTGCCSTSDAADARLVAALLDVPFYVLNFRKEFGRVIDYFVAEYNAGRTPNPCVRCNDWIKFGRLARYAADIDADFIATGHYARVDHAAATPRLLRGVDHRKDQSYVLFGTPLDQLRHMVLPIGGLAKADVRGLAEELGLPVFDKPDSQEICFVPDNDYAGLVQRRSPEAVRPGAILDTAGHVVGEHAGHQHFTIGQRRGVGVALGHKLYVVGKDAAANTITVGPPELLQCHGLAASQTNWLVDPPTRETPCLVKVRYNADPVPARVLATGPDTLEVEFGSPHSAVTPGQAVVCYGRPGTPWEEAVLGGGWIDRAT